MKRKNSLAYLISILLIGGVNSTALMAQTDSTFNWSVLSDAYLDKNWLNSQNPAGLGAHRQGVKSEVVLFGQGRYGGFKNYSSSENETSFGAQASSLARLSRRVVVEGKVGYRNLSAKEVAGSYFIDPSQTPFDLVEYTDANAGDKNLEELCLRGALGVDIVRWFALGASFDYNAASYAKRKDLRHINSLMDMSVVLGGVFHIGESVDLGVNYQYRRRNETLLLSTYGTQDKTFVSLLNYGGFMGKQEVFGEVGYTKENETKPLFDEYHGATMQAVWRVGGVEWFNEAGFRTRAGYYGDPSYSTVVYADHSGKELFYNAGITFTHNSNAHTFGLGLERRHVENRENIYVFRNEESGRDYIDYLGEREVGERTNLSAALSYICRLGIEDGLPRWVLSADASLENRSLKASNYPDYRRQDITWWRTGVAGTRNFLSGKNCYTLSLSASYGGGSGSPCNDGRYGTATEGEALTRTRNDLLMQEWEFLTSSRMGAGVDMGYSRAMWKNQVRGNVTLSYSLQKAFGIEHLSGDMHHTVVLKVGCHF